MDSVCSFVLLVDLNLEVVLDVWVVVLLLLVHVVDLVDLNLEVLILLLVHVLL